MHESESLRCSLAESSLASFWLLENACNVQAPRILKRQISSFNSTEGAGFAA